MKLDQPTIDMAKQSANNDAEIYGFKIGSEKWKASFKKHCDEAIETMSVGRNNPRNMPNPSVTALKRYFPEMFSGTVGISGQLAKGYKSEMSNEAVEQRLLATVTNMVKLFEAGRMGNKTTSKGRYGKMENSEMTDFQLPTRAPGVSDAEYDRISNEVLQRWVTRDLLTALFIEIMIPFFNMTRDDVEQILRSIHVERGTIKNYQEGGEKSARTQLIRAFHATVGKTIIGVDLRKLILGR